MFYSLCIMFVLESILIRERILFPIFLKIDFSSFENTMQNLDIFGRRFKLYTIKTFILKYSKYI